MVVLAVLVTSRWLVAVTVTIVVCVTTGAVKFPVESIVAPEALGTDQTASELPKLSVTLSCTDCVEKTVALLGVTLMDTGGEEEQPASMSKNPNRETQVPAIRFITYPIF